jgi:DNA-binding CsgD family transcriptional regulator
LVFPFLTFALRGEPNTGAVLWIAGYVFFGFFSVYRVVTFSDLSGKKDGLLFIAGFGLMFGRIGDALGALIGIMTTNMQTASVWIAAGLLIATFLLFFRFYNKTYSTIPLQNVSLEDRLHIFEEKYELTSREAEVFELIVSGRSNSEIAADLYVSESTVKFHVRNALRKAGCMNRTELAAKFRKSGMS